MANGFEFDQSWQKELLSFKGVKSLVVLEGNVEDLYPITRMGKIRFLPLSQILDNMFGSLGQDDGSGYLTLHFDPMQMFTPGNVTKDQRDRAAAAIKYAQDKVSEEREASDTLNSPVAEGDPNGHQLLERYSESIGALLSLLPDDDGYPGSPICVIVDAASRLLSSSTNLMPEDARFFANLQRGAEEATAVLRYKKHRGKNVNTLVFISENAHDLPSWFVDGNPLLRIISLPRPDRALRTLFVSDRLEEEISDDPSHRDDPVNRFIDLTDGLSIRELGELMAMYEKEGDRSRLPQLVNLYKYGVQEDKWLDMFDKLKGNPADTIRQRVKGQDQAVEKVVSVLKRSVVGLSGATHSSGSKPKGVLFLAGPTGTGKTEIVKAVTELLFGDERSMLRFDMSEYSAEMSDQKLFGAPPGYVGYAEGGQLTNAVKTNPFSVILFDEIEKANSAIMDKFLQILEDGRLTDGQGTTVYFSETIIFFTSNIGFSTVVRDAAGNESRETIKPGKSPEEIGKLVELAMNNSFKPEFLGRIGDNVVIFNFIDDDTARMIMESKVRQVNEHARDVAGRDVVAGDDVLDLLANRCAEDAVKEKGGRGIGNLVESAYLNPLSNYIFSLKSDEGSSAGGTIVAHVGPDGASVEFSTEAGN